MIRTTRKRYVDLSLCKAILTRLEKGPARYVNLEKWVIRHTDCGSAGRFNYIIKYMIDQGWIDRPERGLYEITEKGRVLLKGLQ